MNISIQAAQIARAKKTHYLRIGALVLVLVIIGCSGRNIREENTPTVALPPLTEAQKLEAAKAPEGMVYVPEGEYLSGIPSSQTTITLQSFYIDRLEVTNEQYVKFINSNPEWQRGAVSLERQDGHYLAAFDGKIPPSGVEKYPVSWVSWFAAQAFCEAEGKRLPTAAEWEKSARGTDGRIYPWGNEFDGTRANFCDRSCPFWDRAKTWDDGFSRTAPVGSIAGGASPYGVLDMSGNVAEWVADWAPSDIDKSLINIQIKDPKGSATGITKLVFGGSWADAPGVGYEPYRTSGQWLPKKTSGQIGFRCAADVK